MMAKCAGHCSIVAALSLAEGFCEMAKRVRGSKLDIELAEAGQAKRPALGSQQEQQTRSALATGLLALWS